MSGADTNVYQSRRIYQIFSLLGGVMILLFAINIASEFRWDSLLFFGTATLFSFYNLRWMLIRLELTPAGITLYEPLRQPQHIDFRQIADFHESGRLVMGISMVYYPIGSGGLVEMDAPQSLFIPALEKQAEVIHVLNQSVPKDL
jgi:hypothetical protein